LRLRLHYKAARAAGVRNQNLHKEPTLNSLIIELQQNALDPAVEITSLLRKALMAARKLGVSEFETWISSELNGYESGVAFPEYRKVRGTLKVHNPYNGWCPLMMGDAELAENLSKRSVGQPISELESLFTDKEKGGFFYIHFPSHIEQQLMSFMEIPLQPALLIGTAQLKGILDGVRNVILDWALKLEEQGVLGEGMTFSQTEKESAHSITYQIENIFGHVTHSQIQQRTKNSSQSIVNNSSNSEELQKLISEFKKNINSLNLTTEDISEAKANIETIEAQTKSSKPKSVIINESLKSLRTVLETVAGNALSEGLIAQIQSLLP
jgi:hypothetical protein